LKVYTEHTDAKLSLIYSSYDANLIVSAARDQSLHIWNIDQHTQTADQPIVMNTIEEEEEEEEEEETSSTSGNKKRHQKPRPNRAERERKKSSKSQFII
jgi:hypothetical protein